jgi:uncharacterized protein
MTRTDFTVACMANTRDRRRNLGLVAAAGLALVAATAMPLVPASAAVAVPEDGTTVLHLTQTAQRQMKRDRVRAELRAEAVGSDPRHVEADINRLMAAALAQAKGVSGIAVETSGYSVYEENQTNAPSRWRGSQGLMLEGGDVGAILALVGDLQAKGLAMSGLGFELSPAAAREAEDELTSEALKRLRERAEKVAGDLQLSVVRLSDIRVGNAVGERPPPRPMMRSLAMSAPAAPPPVAEGGDATVDVTVQADIVLAPKDHRRP